MRTVQNNIFPEPGRYRVFGQHAGMKYDFLIKLDRANPVFSKTSLVKRNG